MIRAICLNPAIDRVYMVDAFEAGKQYRDNLPQLSVGGKGINVARACALLGEETAVYGFVGGVNGRLVAKATQEAGCQNRFIEVAGETRVTINIIDNVLKKETEIIERGISVSDDDVKTLLLSLKKDIKAGDLIVCSGILIGGVPSDIYAQISRLCSQADAMCLLDTNGDHLKQSLGGGYHFLKPNRNELLGLFDAEDTRDFDEILHYAKRALKSNIQSVLVSLGRNGAIYATENVVYKMDVPAVTVNSTIGCGDSMVAGFAVGMARGLELTETLKLACACGVANAASPGICAFSTAQMEKFIQQISLEQIA